MLLLENVQKRFTKKICLKGLNYSQRLDLLEDMSVQKRLMINALLYMYKIIVCGHSVDGFEYDIFSSVTRGSRLKVFLIQAFANHFLYFALSVFGTHLSPIILIFRT